ncbi:nucleotidyl transferase AbiEii/AbiGii toxin family protein [Nocardioides sp. TRM66260-LWL]|uniref:nucleotidyl transferase AbiEii/AbiGii toxin family protein n=1 Tax=Nocardioides sp. TRM66260-LWL TaxID=2874478 RepID=UPI001CC3B006|nr:nucleotidyl transferase AbiEii/AbiGii toxin family protein [Nocardioides sp. TRM66260-LWL]MBZ5735145.1 nucleotidyl transferase AbiEii/AbiGii toxin family protein [Nocardioides sp. TRM66260-LWL]
MISKDELLAQAAVFDLNEADVQRDYLFGWLISGIFRESELADHVVLKGGNALRKGYFPGTRFSDDLDLTSEQGIGAEHLLEQMNGVCRFAEAQTGVRFDIDRNRVTNERMIDETKRLFKLKLYFKDFIGAQDHITLSIRMDVSEFDRLHLAPQTRQLIHPYSDSDACAAEIRCIKLEEALAEKMKCLLQRRYCYDLFDLVYCAFVSQDIEIDRREMLDVFLRKTVFSRSPGSARALLLDLPLDLFRGYWGKVLTPKASRFSFDDAVAQLRTGLDSIFGTSGSQALAASAAFFPSRWRNIILQAGSEQRLLRMTYNNATRLVEPYSLDYRVRKSDGVGQEYFFGYDTTGGRSSGPSIKSFLHQGIQDMVIEDEKFEPRFPVQLSKSGDSDRAAYFAGTRSTSTRRSSTSGPKHRVQCPYCSKTFTRKVRTTALNPHMDRFGNRCYGRRGMYLGYF